MTDSPLVIREATQGDASRIAGIHVRSWRDAYRSFVPQAYLDTLDQDAHRIGYWQPLLDRHPVTAARCAAITPTAAEYNAKSVRAMVAL